MITIIGANGSMGKRYQAILKWMNKDIACFDREDSVESILQSAEQSSHVIVASPTYTHIEYLRALKEYRCKVLCEKPVTKSMDELENICAEYYSAGKSFSMMTQYKELVRSYETGKVSRYNYFRSGPDGLVWDCLQIIGLARGPVELGNDSPIWKCEINGEALNLASMDGAYVRTISKWLWGSLDQGMEEIKFLHEKVHLYLDQQ